MNNQLSISCRIAEGFLSKEQPSMSMQELANLAVAAGFEAICMRGSQVGTHSSTDEIQKTRQILDAAGLSVTMVTGDFDIVYNNSDGPNCLRNIEPYLDLAEALDAPMIRVCIKEDDDIVHVQRAADLALERGLNLVHQCHIQSLFETLEEIESRVREIDRSNFGLIFEAANLEQCGQDYTSAAIKRLAPWLLNVYLQNQKIHPSGVITLDTWCKGPVTFDVCEIPEPGGIDFAALIDGLKQVGYEGPITVHQSAPEDEQLTALQSATQTMQYLRSLS